MGDPHIQEYATRRWLGCRADQDWQVRCFGGSLSQGVRRSGECMRLPLRWWVRVNDVSDSAEKACQLVLARACSRPLLARTQCRIIRGLSGVDLGSLSWLRLAVEGAARSDHQIPAEFKNL